MKINFQILSSQFEKRTVAALNPENICFFQSNNNNYEVVITLILTYQEALPPRNCLLQQDNLLCSSTQDSLTPNHMTAQIEYISVKTLSASK